MFRTPLIERNKHLPRGERRLHRARLAFDEARVAEVGEADLERLALRLQLMSRKSSGFAVAVNFGGSSVSAGRDRSSLAIPPCALWSPRRADAGIQAAE